MRVSWGIPLFSKTLKRRLDDCWALRLKLFWWKQSGMETSWTHHDDCCNADELPHE
jgi:hypothetical protein